MAAILAVMWNQWNLVFRKTLGQAEHTLVLESADLAVNRVAERVRLGGHDVPEVVVRRRYEKGLRNLFGQYMLLAERWQLFDNSQTTGPRLIASGAQGVVGSVEHVAVWQKVTEGYHG